MSNALVALFFAAGVSAFIYTKLGRRVGYGNSMNVFILVGSVFVIIFLFALILLKYVLHLH